MRLILTLSIIFGFFISELKASGGVLEVNWPKAKSQHEKIKRAYPTVLKKATNSITLPIYIPRFYVYDKTMSIVSDKNFYTITIFLKGATLMVSGDRTYQQKVTSANKQFQKMMKASPITFTQAEGMMTTDFNRHGVNYALVLECDSPKSDKRCTQETFLKQIFNGLIIVGGKR